MRTSLRLLGVLGALACACQKAAPGTLTRCDATSVVPSSVKTDILFVVDDSLSMDDDQRNLHDNLRGFIDALSRAPIANDFQIGVTTTSVEEFAGGTTYPATSTEAPGFPYPRGAIVAIRRDATGTPISGALDWTAGGGWGGTRLLRAGSPTLVDDFMANVLVGVEGSSKEQPFRAARLALSDRVADGTNGGFLRPGARLAIVFMSDEDDCSDSGAPFVTSNDQCHDPTIKDASPPVLDTVADLVSFLRGPVGGEARDVLVASIAGLDPTTLGPSCGDVALCSDRTCAAAWDSGDRFIQLAGLLGPAHTRLASICASFADTLLGIAQLLVAQSVPLEGEPADWHMLAVGVERAGLTLTCDVQLDGTAAAASADAIYTPPVDGQPPRLTFQNGCKLQQGDAVQVRVVCAQ